VLEFYSCLSRQQEAQLPKLSATIGALIAQMARRLEQQATMLYLAQVDELTGLSNRSHFHELLNQACEVSAQAQTPFNLAFIDLDRFKPINDPKSGSYPVAGNTSGVLNGPRTGAILSLT
jgi:GGDEF domain-containing protein